MQTDQRARVSIPLAHDHFSTKPSGQTGPGASSDNAAPPARLSEQSARAAAQAWRGISGAARQAFKAGKYATAHTIAAAQWSHKQSAQLAAKSAEAATKLKARMAKRKAKSIASAGRDPDASAYSSVPSRLSALAPFTEQQHALARTSLPGRQTHQSGSMMLAEGEQTPHPTFILSGWAARTRVQNGNLHVLGLLVPGDGICVFGPPCAVASTNLIALTTVETADAGPMLDLANKAGEDSPFRVAMHRAMAEDEAFLLNQTMRLMMKPAEARLAHLLLELQYRLMRVGLATESHMPFPLDRRILGAALGLPPRLVGRITRTLDQRKIVKFGNNRLVIRRPDVLQKLAGFAPPAFIERTGRRLISDVAPDDIAIEPGPWMDGSGHRPLEVHVPRQRPA